MLSVGQQLLQKDAPQSIHRWAFLVTYTQWNQLWIWSK